MNWSVTPGLPLNRSVTIPSSKSQTMRALLFASMGEGRSHLEGLLESPDTRRMRAACCALGARMDGGLIEGVAGQPLPVDQIDAGNSGIILRFMTALAALAPGVTRFTGDSSVMARPMGQLLSALEQLGATSGHALQGGHARLEGADSQPVSALLIALSYLPGEHTLEVIEPGETPWIDLTLSWLPEVTHSNYTHYTIPGRRSRPPIDYRVPGDYSSAAFPLAASLVTGSTLTLDNLQDDPQGDRELISQLREMGAEIDETYTVHGGALRGCEIDCNRFIDALPILAVLGCFASGETHLRNGAIARTKECDRIAVMAAELRRMGADIMELEDGLRIRSSRLRGAHLSSHGDHRVALSLAVAALGAEGSSLIEDVDCVAKTYPTFLEDLCGR